MSAPQVNSATSLQSFMVIAAKMAEYETKIKDLEDEVYRLRRDGNRDRDRSPDSYRNGDRDRSLPRDRDGNRDRSPDRRYRDAPRSEGRSEARSDTRGINVNDIQYRDYSTVPAGVYKHPVREVLANKGARDILKYCSCVTTNTPAIKTDDATFNEFIQMCKSMLAAYTGFFPFVKCKRLAFGFEFQVNSENKDHTLRIVDAIETALLERLKDEESHT